MLRVTLLLLLSAAAASCCAPNSPRRTDQPRECASLGLIPDQTIFAEFAPNQAPTAFSSPAVVNGRTSCDTATPILLFVNSEGRIARAVAMQCIGGRWFQIRVGRPGERPGEVTIQIPYNTTTVRCTN